MHVDRRIAWSLVVAAVVAGCSDVQSPLHPVADQASHLATLLGLMTWVCGAMYLAVLVFLGASLWRRRAARVNRSDGPEEPTLDGRGDAALGRGLGAWAAVIVVGLTILCIGSFVADRRLWTLGREPALDVRVTAQQWWWRIEYRDPATNAWIETANELHLPANRTTRIALASSDVIHSFWIPNVAGKMDVVPGRTNTVAVTPRVVGWSRGQCGEFCGIQHAHMALDVRVDEPAAFATWLAAQARAAATPGDAALARGMRIATTGACASCHAVRGTEAHGTPGPDLTHVGSRRSIAAGTLPMTRGALQGWIAQPQALKPGTLMPPVTLEPADADAVSRYLESLR